MHKLRNQVFIEDNLRYQRSMFFGISRQNKFKGRNSFVESELNEVDVIKINAISEIVFEIQQEELHKNHNEMKNLFVCLNKKLNTLSFEAKFSFINKALSVEFQKTLFNIEMNLFKQPIIDWGLKVEITFTWIQFCSNPEKNSLIFPIKLVGHYVDLISVMDDVNFSSVALKDDFSFGYCHDSKSNIS